MDKLKHIHFDTYFIIEKKILCTKYLHYVLESHMKKVLNQTSKYLVEVEYLQEND